MASSVRRHAEITEESIQSICNRLASGQVTASDLEQLETVAFDPRFHLSLSQDAANQLFSNPSAMYNPFRYRILQCLAENTYEEAEDVATPEQFDYFVHRFLERHLNPAYDQCHFASSRQGYWIGLLTVYRKFDRYVPLSAPGDFSLLHEYLTVIPQTHFRVNIDLHYTSDLDTYRQIIEYLVSKCDVVTSLTIRSSFPLPWLPMMRRLESVKLIADFDRPTHEPKPVFVSLEEEYTDTIRRLRSKEFGRSIRMSMEASRLLEYTGIVLAHVPLLTSIDLEHQGSRLDQRHLIQPSAWKYLTRCMFSLHSVSLQRFHLNISHAPTMYHIAATSSFVLQKPVEDASASASASASSDLHAASIAPSAQNEMIQEIVAMTAGHVPKLQHLSLVHCTLEPDDAPCLKVMLRRAVHLQSMCLVDDVVTWNHFVWDVLIVLDKLEELVLDTPRLDADPEEFVHFIQDIHAKSVWLVTATNIPMLETAIRRALPDVSVQTGRRPAQSPLSNVTYIREKRPR